MLCLGQDPEGAESGGTEDNTGEGRVCLGESIISWYRTYTLANSPGDDASTLVRGLLDA